MTACAYASFQYKNWRSRYEDFPYEKRLICINRIFYSQDNAHAKGPRQMGLLTSMN